MSVIRFWKVEINFSSDDDRTVTYFANEGLAKLAVEWAYSAHVDALQHRQDVSLIQETQDPTSGAWKGQELYGKKVTWWKETTRGFIGMKDYFTAEPKGFQIIGD